MGLGGEIKQESIKQEKSVRSEAESQVSSQFCSENIKIILILGHPWPRNILETAGMRGAG
jgi:hypothetical protein